MTTLVVYDSLYGNTEKIARAIAEALVSSDEVKLMRAAEVPPAKLPVFDLLIVGSPTQGGRPTPAIQEFLNQLPDHGLNGTDVAAFDTRILAQEQGIGMRMLLRLIGYAAGRIADRLTAKGGDLAAPPEGFIVEDKEGPLKPGEEQRAAAWAMSALRQREPSMQVATTSA